MQNHPELLALLERRFALAKAYYALTEKLETAITSDDDATLLTILEEREALAAEIDVINKTADAALAEYKKSSGTAEVEALLERTRELFVKCLTYDRKNMAEIKAQMSKATGDSRELQKRREGISKYAQSDYIYAPSVLDKHQ